MDTSIFPTPICVVNAKGALQKSGEQCVECWVGAVGWDEKCVLSHEFKWVRTNDNLWNKLCQLASIV